MSPSLLTQQQPITVPLTTLEDAEDTIATLAVGLMGGERAKCNAAGILSWATHPGACVGLAYDKKSTDEHDCAIACCEDPSCEIWQFDEAQDHGCWRGKPSGCQAAPLKQASGVRPGAKLPPNHPGPGKESKVVASVYNSTAQEVVILSNTADTGQPNGPKTAADGATVRWGGQSYHICAGSSLLLSGGKLIFNTSIDSDGPETQTLPAALTTDHAHEVLADPSLRANLLLRLLGGPDESTERKMPQDFLMEVLEWNETLDEITEDQGSEPASREARLIHLQDELLQRREDLLVEVGAALMPLPEPKSESLALLRRRLNAARYLARTLWRIREMRLTEQGLSGATKPPL